MRCIGHAPRYAPVTAHWREDLSVPAPSDNFVYSFASGAELDTAIKYDAPDTVMCPVRTNIVREYIVSKLSIHCVFVHVPKSFWQLIDHVELRTSPGCLHNNKFVDKVAFFGDPDVKLLLDKDTPFMDFPWTGFSKEEIVRKGKKTRQITGCDARFLYQVLPLSHEFNKNLEVKGRGLPMFLGSSMMGDDWKWFVDYFSSCEYFLCTDGKKFDSSVPNYLVQQCCAVRSRFLSERYHAALQALYDQVNNKVVVEPDGKMFVATHGVPSGHPSTAHDNSIVSWFQILYALKFFVSFDYIDTNVRLAIYGDDVVIGFVQPPPFTVAELCSALRLSGLDPDSGDHWLSFVEIDFLSRKPVVYDGHYVPVMKRHEKMLTSMRWIDNSMTVLQRISKLVSLREALAGTPAFAEANAIVEAAFLRFSDLGYSNDPMFVKARTMMYTQDYILRVRGGLPFKEAGSIGNQIIRPFFMSEHKKGPARNSKPGQRKPQRNPRNNNNNNNKNSQGNRSRNAKGPMPKRDPKRRAAKDSVPLISANNVIRPYLKALADTLPIEGRDLLLELNGNTSNTALDIREVVINPGHSVTFPKIHRIAANYRKFNFEYLRLRFVSSSAATTNGKIVMYADVSSEIPTTDVPVTAQNRKLMTSCPLWESTCLDITPAAVGSALKSYFVKTKAEIDALETANDFARLDQCIPFWFAYGSLASSTSNLIGTIYIEYKLKLMEFVPTTELAFAVTANAINAATLVQSPVYMPSPSAGVGLNNPVAGDIVDDSNINESKTALGAYGLEKKDVCVVPDGTHVVNIYAQFAALLSQSADEIRLNHKLHALRNDSVAAYWAQLTEGIDEKNPIRLRDTPNFDPDRIEARHNGVYYYDTVLAEWIICPTLDERRTFLQQQFGLGAAGDTEFYLNVGDFATNAVYTIFSYLSGSTSLLTAASTIIIDAIRLASPYLFTYLGYTPSAFGASRQMSKSSLTLQQAKYIGPYT